MSFFAKIFGGAPNPAEVPSASNAIQRLLKVEEMLIKKQEYLESQANKELQIAKKHGTKNKRAALQALKKKKKYEKQLAQIDGTMTTIEYQRDALENASTNTEILNVMKFSADALEKAHGKMDLDTVHDIMDDIQEQQQVAQELSDALSTPSFGIYSDIDDDEMLNELDELMGDELLDDLVKVSGTEDLPKLPDDLVKVPGTEDLPKLPDSRAAKSKVQDEDDLKELAAWAT